MELKPIVHVVDDDSATRDAMTVLLHSVRLQVACYESADDFLGKWEPGLPGCIVLDLRMPGMSGLELQAALDGQGYCPPIIFLTGHGNVAAAVRAMHEGAADFLTKPINDESLLERVHEAIDLDRERRREADRKATIHARLDLLTPREREVMEGVVAGKSNKEIGRELGISHKTVELHRANMMAKVHAGSIAQLVQMRLAG